MARLKGFRTLYSSFFNEKRFIRLTGRFEAFPFFTLLTLLREFGAHIALEIIKRRVFIAANALNRSAKSTKDHKLAKTTLNQTFDRESLQKLLLEALCFFFRFDSLFFVLFQVKVVQSIVITCFHSF